MTTPIRTMARLILVGLALAGAGAGIAGTSDEWYRENLARVLTKYGSLAGVPKDSVAWIARTFKRTAPEVVADLGKQEGALRKVPPATSSGKEVPIRIPDAAWKAEPDLDPAYARLLEETLAKYQGIAFVPPASVRWIARREGRSEEQVRRDMMRVDKGSSEVASDAAYAF